ncbi:MAG: Mur ligase family protein [Erysipelotrichaceae bacterium]|nr:Mur ligase family protein [Erysipelotrichaceae bacterium]
MNIIIIVLFILLQHNRFIYISNILQNQYYEIKRYIYYIFENKKRIIIKVVIATIILLLTLVNKYFIILFPCLFIDKIANKIKKFVFSKRIKRQLVIFEILNLINFLFFYDSLFYYLIVYNLLIYWLSFIISCLIEKIIQRKYIKKAKRKLKEYNVLVIAITGSYGKTSVKNYIYELIKKTYHTLKSPKSYNTLNGILLTINEMLKPYHEVLILEVGVDKINGMNKVIKNIPIDIAVLTKIGKQHIKTFKNIENIAKEKCKLLHAAKKMAIYSIDDKYVDKKNISCTSKTFSLIDKNATAYMDIDKQIVFLENKRINTDIKLLGKHNYYNVLCAMLVAYLLNVSEKQIVLSVSKLENVKHRLSLHYQNNWIIIDDSYNSNIEGFINALEVLKSFDNKKVLITPGIIEQIDDSYNNLLADKINECVDLSLLINKPSFNALINHKIELSSFNDAYNYLKNNYYDEKLTILIENDVPDIYLK